MSKKSIIFDLDDTLYNEIDYLKSAYKEIATVIAKNCLGAINAENIFNSLWLYYSQKKDAFQEVIVKYNLKNIVKEDLLKLYRNHYPSINLTSVNENLLRELKESGYKLGLITDGRSIQQRNKIKALNIEKYFEYILISEEFGSEKPHQTNFNYFVELLGESSFFYVADNVNKDFITPNKMGWKTICLLDNGLNIHKQDFSLKTKYLPQYKIKSLNELKNII